MCMIPIRRVQIFGERCSGTNYLQRLVLGNVRGVRLCWDFGWKHFFHRPGVEAATDCLFLVVHRDPFDWLQSLNRHPWHADPGLHGLPFGIFIRREWRCVWDETAAVRPGDPRYGTEMAIERDPATGLRFANPMRLRTAKLKDWDEVGRSAASHARVRFEDLAADPRGVADALTARFALRRRWRFRDPGWGSGRAGPARYPAVTGDDRAFIVGELDAEVEAALGYDLALPPADGRRGSAPSET